jgi:hypothetical protein
MSEVVGSLPPVPAGATLSWSQVWISAITRPSVETFERIIGDPRASSTRAYGWIVVSALIAFGISMLEQSIFPTQTGFGSQETVFNSPLLLIVCGAPFVVVFSILGLMIGAGITQLIAGALGGSGTYSRLAYAFAAYLAPLSLLSSLIGSIPFVQCLAFPLGIYGIVLNVIAVKAVNRFDWGRAVASSLLILAAILVLVGIVIIIVLVLLGPAIGNVFSNILQNLGTPVP